MALSDIVLAGIAALLVAAGLIALPPLRRRLIARPLLAACRRALPPLSATERDALAAGTVWWEGELFRGRPDWVKLLAFPVPALSEEEAAFLANEVAEACRLVDDWQVTQELHDLPVAAWRYLADKGFFGMIIPRQHGGLGFSAYAHSQVVARLASRSSALAVSVMVPNSLGPAELLLHYGTEEQKRHYLPRLARGLDIPAFALTSPWAGSDAASIPDYGVVCRGFWQGREVLGMRVSWDKRYITLAPVCTLLGLAFRLYDPERLLGGEKDLGITCALVPADHPGVETGRRHFPLNAMFMNGPTRGRDVFMPLDFIIGGPKMAGEGWRMLMECLAAGRAISLPSSSAGLAQLVARAVGGYSRVRCQFRTPVGRFEGVEEALARIGANTYLVDAARKLTAAAIDRGERPAVLSAMVKYHATERTRRIVSDGMDIMGGKGICLGPANFLGRAYQQAPIAITVEGANILTRSLIIFGQGAVRCHPWLLAEMEAARDPDHKRGLAAFDRALWGHAGHLLKNAWRTLVLGLSGARLAPAPVAAAPECAGYYRQLGRFSAAFALLADLTLLLLGGSLKRREKLSARLGDILSQMFLASATLKRYESEGRQEADAPLLHWAVQDALYQAQQAFEGILGGNYPAPALGRMLKWMIFPWGRPCLPPSDRLGQAVAQLLIEPAAARDRLTAECFVPGGASEPVGAIEAALQASVAAEPIDARIREAERQGMFAGNPLANVRDISVAAWQAGVVSAAEYEMLKRRDILRDIVLRVDDFPFDYGPATTRPVKEREAA